MIKNYHFRYVFAKPINSVNRPLFSLDSQPPAPPTLIMRGEKPPPSIQ